MPSFTTSDGLNLHFDDQGDGAPVLCLAGLTRNGDDFAYLLPHLAGHRVIRLDYRGRGLSDYATDWSTYTIPTEARDVIELLDHLGLERVSIIGTSRGGLVAMALASMAPERLDRVIFNDIGPVIDMAGLGRIMAYVGTSAPLPDLEAGARQLAAAHAADFPGVPLDRWRTEAAARWTAGPEGLTLRYDAHLRDALMAVAGQPAPPDPWAFFAPMTGLPLGVIRGANSDLLSAETLAEMHKRHPGMRSVTVPDRGHVPFLDEPEALALIHDVLS
ncbi:alpha/beta fold hydrolase [Roseisalinus antarcticus]|uniref:Haloacetate dehalogenase H-1 n=1 Tax=Roseisalinus antarcticus TaxID=254357 RepID=A0A1Y5SVL2_9RHOB|nr:alpha/beta hydrolase [Roseisalinus antarcticus]SLN49613.1 Haloacetate dehalogenase H-1 [Roseisalinus antarcticus]